MHHPIAYGAQLCPKPSVSWWSILPTQAVHDANLSNGTLHLVANKDEQVGPLGKKLVVHWATSQKSTGQDIRSPLGKKSVA